MTAVTTNNRIQLVSHYSLTTPSKVKKIKPFSSEMKKKKKKKKKKHTHKQTSPLFGMTADSDNCQLTDLRQL